MVQNKRKGSLGRIEVISFLLYVEIAKYNDDCDRKAFFGRAPFLSSPRPGPILFLIFDT